MATGNQEIETDSGTLREILSLAGVESVNSSLKELRNIKIVFFSNTYIQIAKTSAKSPKILATF